MISTVERGSKCAKRQTTGNAGGLQGNRNALKHGRRSAAAILKRRVARAELKALAFIGLSAGIFSASGVRHRPLREDQIALLRMYRPQALRLLSAV
jgi:hypothetical protein